MTNHLAYGEIMGVLPKVHTEGIRFATANVVYGLAALCGNAPKAKLH